MVVGDMPKNTRQCFSKVLKVRISLAGRGREFRNIAALKLKELLTIVAECTIVQCTYIGRKFIIQRLI